MGFVMSTRLREEKGMFGFRETNFLLPSHGLFIKYYGYFSIIWFK